MILPTQIREVLSSNEISQIQLKDGTIIRITDSNIPQYNIASQEVQQSSSMNSVELEEKEGGHNHHKGMGYFGHHFKTQKKEKTMFYMSQKIVLKMTSL